MDTPLPTNPPETTQTEGSTSFISAGDQASNTESTYSDFFQETSDGNISIGPKAQKSGLEITTTVLGYIVPLVIIVGVFGALHVFIRTGGGAQSIRENYSFLCPYLTYGVNFPDGEKDCQPLTTITSTYKAKKDVLQENIINKLAEYIPLKITKNLLVTSPERAFVIKTYNEKLKPDEIMGQFENVKQASVSTTGDNIVCNGMSITGDGNLTTQCTIYGASLGENDENGKLGSARIEALRFIDILGDTNKSHFILLNPPSSLTMEDVAGSNSSGEYKTRTILSIQLQYVPVVEKP